MQLCACVLSAMWTRRQLLALRTHVRLTHFGGIDDTSNQWTLLRQGQPPLHGAMLKMGYKSAVLLILVFKDDTSGKVQKLPIWRDSVSDLHFSYLNLQLMFNTFHER